jgi:iron complex transport system substrate-binding protein
MTFNPAAGRLLLPLLLLFAWAAGCEDKARPGPAQGGEVRLVSLAPALTDILFDMGLGERVVGVSRYCELPPGEKRKVVGDMVSADTELLLSVRPTHLLFQGPADHFANVARLDPSIRLEGFRIETLDSIGEAVERIGRLAGRPDLARKTLAAFTGKIEAARERSRGLQPMRVLFLMDSRRMGFMAAGPDNFIDDLIAIGNGVNLGRFLPGSGKWRKTELETLLAARPDLVICQVDPEEPGRKQKARKKWSRYLGQPGMALRRVEVVDDPRWTFPSTRIADLALEMARLIHPQSGR